MRNTLLKYTLIALIVPAFSACLKSNPYAEDFSSTQPIADIPKAPANALTKAPTTSWLTLDTTAGGVDYPTAVHIAAKDHVGDVTIRMKIDKTAGQAWAATHAPYVIIPDSLYTVSSLDVKITNAGVFTTGDFVVHIKTNAKDASNKNVFKQNKFVLPVAIDQVTSANYTVAENFRYVLWYIVVK